MRTASSTRLAANSFIPSLTRDAEHADGRSAARRGAASTSALLRWDHIGRWLAPRASGVQVERSGHCVCACSACCARKVAAVN
eukprot:6202274-Pleurochrysis_carterae.AAC.1